MQIRTETGRGYLIRLTLVTLGATVFTLWPLYDGIVAYPYQKERAEEYGRLFDEFSELDDGGLRLEEEWELVAAERGWPLDPPEGAPKTKFDIASQFIMAGMIAPVAIVFSILLIRARGRWIEATEDGLATSWGQKVDYARIETLDKKLWKNKGIVKIFYQDDAGRKKKIVLDDCKYEPDSTEAILRHLESQIDEENIVGGQPLAPLPEATDEAESHVDQDAS